MKRLIFKALAILLALILIPSLSAGCFLPNTSTITRTTEAPSASPIVPDWTPERTGGNPTLPDMVSVVEKVKPSVVVIDVTEEGAGSGWIVRSDGVIVTNNHVVEGAQEITVTLDDGRSFTAKGVASDPLSDLAVIKIDATELPAARVGDSSKLRVGMLVAVIGNALGRGISMTGGWVSRLGVSLSDSSGGQTLYDLIETDAAINPGNSGGPLVNTAGEVIGITSAKLVDVTIEGVGYAIAINTAMPIIMELATRGYVVRPWFGISLLTVKEGIASRYGLSVNKGALITQIAARSPATDAGLKHGDVIVGINEKKIATADEMVLLIRASEVGQGVKITFWRGDKKLTTELTPVERPR